MASLSIQSDLSSLNKKIRVALLSEGGEVRADVQRRARNVKNRAQRNARSMFKAPTGKLADSIRYTTRTTEDGFVAQVGSDLQYARWAHDGTGIHGPHRTPIVPTKRKAMRFPGKGGAIIFTKKSSGMVGQPYLAEALVAAAE